MSHSLLLDTLMKNEGSAGGGRAATSLNHVRQFQLHPKSHKTLYDSNATGSVYTCGFWQGKKVARSYFLPTASTVCKLQLKVA